MCGICGVLRFDGLESDIAQLVQSMGEKLIHRGPDNYGYHDDPFCALGFRRLSIIDLDTGNQPIGNEDGTIWIVFNGEIYNFKELRTQLMIAGHVFSTNTDTEVILHAYEEFGVDSLKYLRGMFAFAIWDSKRQQLVLARDRLGKKPLYYFFSKEGIIFGSELKAILQCKEVPREVDLLALDAYLAYGYIQPPRTILNGVNKLSPGSYMLISIPGRSSMVRQYWELEFTPKLAISEEEAVDQIRRTLTEAVRIRMFSDVPLGALLSGGIDSTIVTGLMAQLSSLPVKTFSIGFDEIAYNELPYARLVAERFKTDHHELIVHPDIAQIVPEVIYYLDEPMDDSSAIPTYLVAKMARQHVTVVLNGDGGDEAFSGYEHYGDTLSLLLSTKMIPRRMNRFIRSSLMMLPEKVDLFRLITRARTLTELNNLSLGEILSRGFQRWPLSKRQYLYHPEVWQTLQASANPFPEETMLNEYKKFAFLGAIDQMLAVDGRNVLPGDLLVKMDRMSMANSLEARSPFLDQELSELAARLPENFKRNGSSGKILLKKAFLDLIPAPILKRPKKGFAIPLGIWFKNELNEMLHDTLLSKNACNTVFFSSRSVANILSEHQSGRENHDRRIWGLLVLELWQQQYLQN